MGAGFGSGGMLGNGCGPLGCNGGTFGDGRNLGDLFGNSFGNFAGLGRSLLTPYGEGGVASQRWFDLYGEATYLRREKGAGNFVFSTQGVGPVSSSNVALQSDDVDLNDYELGLSLLGNVQIGPGSNVEVGYFGLNEWDASATAVSATPTLYSFFSDFGLDPPGGFDDPDRSLFHRVNYSSRLNNGEVNLRRRWAEPSGFVQGSWLAGIRYFHLSEMISFQAAGANNNAIDQNGPRFFDYSTKTRNHLTGFQVGGDLWLNLIPGVKVGGELKGGIFGNQAIQETSITANSVGFFGTSAINERASDGKTAYLVQASAQAVYRMTYSWALRGSYQVIYVDNVALAPENINRAPPGLFLPNSARVVRVNNDSEVFYSGFTAGAEYTW
jgi:hypothetical protein